MAGQRVRIVYIAKGEGFRINTFPSFSLAIEGLKKGPLGRMANRAELRRALAAASHKEAQRVLELADARAPKESGQMAASGRVEDMDMSARSPLTNIAYGGPAGAGGNTEDVPYAYRQHMGRDPGGPAYKRPHGGETMWLAKTIAEERTSGRLAKNMTTDLVNYIRDGSIPAPARGRPKSVVPKAKKAATTHRSTKVAPRGVQAETKVKHGIGGWHERPVTIGAGKVERIIPIGPPKPPEFR